MGTKKKSKLKKIISGIFGFSILRVGLVLGADGYIEGEGIIYDVMNSSGAGLGKLFIYLGASIPLLFIGIAFVYGIVGVGRAIADILRVT